MSSCCSSSAPEKPAPSCCSATKSPKKRFDALLWFSFLGVSLLYAFMLIHPAFLEQVPWLKRMSHSAYDLMNSLWWGVVIGGLFIGLLSKVPREFVQSLLGKGGTFAGLLRAAGAGVLLDLCSHGILMIGVKLYERGASAGQLMAFLLASPWNSFSLTIVLIALIGWQWTLAFILLSLVIALITGWIFDWLVKQEILPANPYHLQVSQEPFDFWQEACRGISTTRYDLAFFKSLLISAVLDSRMVVRWLLFGVLLASLLQGFITPDNFGAWFGPTFLGLALTTLMATVLEVCSEGSAPIGADLVTKAQAPGNGFAFLMAGVATDYTEIMIIKSAAKSWKIALFLPLISVPQILLVAWLINFLA